MHDCWTWVRPWQLRQAEMTTRMDNSATAAGANNIVLARRYCALFVNRLAYTLQSHKADQSGKHYYYRPKRDRRLSLQTVREHLNGQLTFGLYALNPNTQRSKWVAIDADYENALEDLLKLQWELRQDRVKAAL